MLNYDEGDRGHSTPEEKLTALTARLSCLIAENHKLSRQNQQLLSQLKASEYEAVAYKRFFKESWVYRIFNFFDLRKLPR